MIYRHILDDDLRSRRRGRQRRWRWRRWSSGTSRRGTPASSAGTFILCRSWFRLSNPGEPGCEIDSPTPQRCAVTTSRKLAHPHIQGLGRRLHGFGGLCRYSHGELDLFCCWGRGSVLGSGIVGVTNHLLESLDWLVSRCRLSWRLHFGWLLVSSGTGRNRAIAVDLWRHLLTWTPTTATRKPPVRALAIRRHSVLRRCWRRLALLLWSFGVAAASTTSGRATPSGWEFATEGPEAISLSSRIGI